MSEKRFEFKLKVNFIDEETGEKIYHKMLIDNSNGNEIGFDDMVGLLNELAEENEQLKQLLKEAEDEIENLKKSNKGLMESIVEKDEQINKLKKEVDEYKEAIINKVQYYEDIEDFAIKKGLIKKDWAKFDGYD